MAQAPLSAMLHSPAPSGRTKVGVRRLVPFLRGRIFLWSTHVHYMHDAVGLASVVSSCSDAIEQQCQK